MIISE